MAAAGITASSEVSILGTAEGLDALAPEWDALMAAMPRPSPFLSHTWVTTWWRHFGGSSRLLVVTLRSAEGELVGVAPLHVASRRVAGLPVRALEFLGYRGSAVCTDHLDFLARGPERHAAVARMFEALVQEPSWDTMALADIAEDSPLRAVAAAVRLPHVALPAEICYYRPLFGSAGEFAAAIRQEHPNLASMLRRRRKRLAQHPDSRFVATVDGGAEIATVMGELARLHGLARNRQGQSGNFCRPDYRAFHDDVALKLAASGRLYLARWQFEGRIAAVLYGLVEGGVLYFYQSGFDTALGSHGLGTVLMGDVMEDAAGRLGLREFDFLRGDEEYKTRWTSLARTTWTVHVWRQCWRGTAARAAWHAARGLAGARAWAARRWRKFAQPVQGGAAAREEAV